MVSKYIRISILNTDWSVFVQTQAKYEVLLYILVLVERNQ